MVTTLGIPQASTKNWKAYTDSVLPFIVLAPTDWTVNSSFVNGDLGPDRTLSGTAFIVPQSMVTGTNLGSDTSISILKNTFTTTCDASEFLDTGSAIINKKISVNGKTWTLATNGDAGAGNRYLDTVVSYPHEVTATNPCLGIDLHVHYAVLENFPAGTVSAYDSNTLTGIYESMVKSFVQKQQ